jgi:tripartite-type tricarboxylate transporter receptor subunit TctC
MHGAQSGTIMSIYQGPVWTVTTAIKAAVWRTNPWNGNGMKMLRAILMVTFVGQVLTAAAQGYPTRPITMVVPFSPGGPTDTIARILSESISRTLAQTVLVENRAGAGGSIAVGRVVHAAPDGYTLSIGHIGTHVINGAVYQLPYDLLSDLEPVAMIATNPQVIVSKISVPAKDLKELIAWVKANQEKVTLGTGGAGTPAHISGVQFQNVTGTKLQIVHYRGSAPSMQDLIAGHIDLDFDQAALALPQVLAGKIRAYAVTAKNRLLAAPEIPTVDEAGLPGFYMAVWHGIWVPKNTPKEIIAKLNSSILQALRDPTVQGTLSSLGQEIPPPEQQTPEALGSFQKAEIDRWWPIIKAAQIKPE